MVDILLALVLSGCTLVSDLSFNQDPMSMA